MASVQHCPIEFGCHVCCYCLICIYCAVLQGYLHRYSKIWILIVGRCSDL